MLKLNIVPPKPDINNDWTVKQIVDTWKPYTWEKVFDDAKLELYDISDILEEDKAKNGRYYPDTVNLFKAFELTKLTDVKVLILGQDPYINLNPDGTPQAQGLSFSVARNAKVPPSLVNIYKEISANDPTFITPSHGDLTSWAKQGVLLLNGCLTVRSGQSGSHKKLWLPFIKKVVNAILETNPECIFVLWGNSAKNVKNMLGQRAVMLEAAHPSPLSYNRGFKGCNHFNQINDLLFGQGKTKINWQL